MRGAAPRAGIAALAPGTAPRAPEARFAGVPARRADGVGADAVVVSAYGPGALKEVRADRGMRHAVDLTGDPDPLAFTGNAVRLGGRVVSISGQDGAPPPLAADFMRLESTLTASGRLPHPWALGG